MGAPVEPESPVRRRKGWFERQSDGAKAAIIAGVFSIVVPMIGLANGLLGDGDEKGEALPRISEMSPLVGHFVQKPFITMGCLTGLRFQVTRHPLDGSVIWVMAYAVANPAAVYPERRLDLVDSQAAVDPFPVGDGRDPAGTEFMIVAIVLAKDVSDRYTNAAAATGQFPVENAMPKGEILDRFSVSRGSGRYQACY